MSRRRWIADEVAGDTAALIGEHALHLARVLRAQVGQEFDIATGTSVRRGTVTSISPNRVEFLLGDLPGDERRMKASPQVTLVLSIFKFDRMEWAIEKCTEIGVARILPVIARRTDAHLAAAAVKRHERWVRIVRQASEQSRRASIPEVVSPVKLGDVNVPAGASRVVLAESEEESQLREVLQSRLGEVVLAVGPEGGWADEEMIWFRENGWAAASLGDSILRTETAAIVGCALALDEAGSQISRASGT